MTVDVFTASNGIHVNVDQDCVGYGMSRLDYGTTQALREYFRAEEDERLGRWRSPEFPDYVVYPRANEWIIILSEPDGVTFGRTRATKVLTGNPPVESVARAYFDAHPKPKPWHDAKHNEIWVLFVAISEEAYRVDDDAFVPVNNPSRIRIRVTDPRIQKAHRIYPEDA